MNIELMCGECERRQEQGEDIGDSEPIRREIVVGKATSETETEHHTS